MDSSNILQLFVTALYYVIVGVLIILSLFGIYLLSAHGRSRTLSITVCLVYIIAFLAIFAASQRTLTSLF